MNPKYPSIIGICQRVPGQPWYRGQHFTPEQTKLQDTTEQQKHYIVQDYTRIHEIKFNIVHLTSQLSSSVGKSDISGLPAKIKMAPTGSGDRGGKQFVGGKI